MKLIDINNLKSVFLLTGVLLMIINIGLQSSSNEVSAISICADCEMNNTCVVTCCNNPNGSQTPICGNYGDQPCDCSPLVLNF